MFGHFWPKTIHLGGGGGDNWFNPFLWGRGGGGGGHNRLIQLYRDAGGGECPVVTSISDEPACGTTSSRFGCWTCTVVKKDKSLTGFVDVGFKRFTPLLEFRDWLIEIRDDPARRLARRRNGTINITANGDYIPGPFNIPTRQEILKRLLSVQSQSGMSLIHESEIKRIKELWVEDVVTGIQRHLDNSTDDNSGDM